MLRGRTVACQTSRWWARSWTHQKAAPIWLPWETCQLQVAMTRSGGVDRSNLRIGRSGGEPVGEEKVRLAIRRVF